MPLVLFTRRGDLMGVLVNRRATTVVAALVAVLIVALNLYLIYGACLRGEAMFQNLLVPLDGSPMAESALPAAAYLAPRLGAHVTLMHCIERAAPEKVHGERHLREPEEARAYLEEAAARAFPPEVEVACHTHAPQSPILLRPPTLLRSQ